MASNRVLVFSLEKKFESLENDIKISASKVLKFFKKEGFLVEIYLLGNSKIKLINNRLRGKNRPTNVLSFNEPEKFPHPELDEKSKGFKPLGEIYLNPDYLKKSGGKDKELTFLLIHGLLHLFGYDHEKKNDRIEMEKLEKNLFKKIFD